VEPRQARTGHLSVVSKETQRMKTMPADTAHAPVAPHGVGDPWPSIGARLVPTGLAVAAVSVLLAGAPADLIAGALPAPPNPAPYAAVSVTPMSH